VNIGDVERVIEIVPIDVPEDVPVDEPYEPDTVPVAPDEEEIPA